MEIDEFLETYPDNIAELASLLRSFVKTQAPEASETLHAGWRVITFGATSGSERRFCAIAPHANWVNLQFHEGAELADPDNLLEGTGQSMRHVKIHSAAHLSDALATLIQAAVAYANR